MSYCKPSLVSVGSYWYKHKYNIPLSDLNSFCQAMGVLSQDAPKKNRTIKSAYGVGIISQPNYCDYFICSNAVCLIRAFNNTHTHTHTVLILPYPLRTPYPHIDRNSRLNRSHQTGTQDPGLPISLSFSSPFLFQTPLDTWRIERSVSFQALLDTSHVQRPVSYQALLDTSHVQRPVSFQALLDTSNVQRPVPFQALLDSLTLRGPFLFGLCSIPCVLRGPFLFRLCFVARSGRI